MTNIRRRSGLALLEVLVALVILSLAIAGYLALFHGSHQLVARSREWSSAVAYATDAMERAKRDPLERNSGRTEALPGGFLRSVAIRGWQPGLALISVTVILPTGGRFALHRLKDADPDHPSEQRTGPGQTLGGGHGP